MEIYSYCIGQGHVPARRFYRIFLVKILNSLVIDSYQETTKSSTPITEISIKDEVGSMVLLKDGNLFKGMDL